MKLLPFFAIFMLACSALSGCATLFGDNKHTVSVNSQPAGAQVYLNNQYVGVTPIRLTLDDIWSTNVVQIKASGYPPATKTIDARFQPVGWLNILFFPGFIIDAVRGNTKKIPHEAKSIDIHFAQNTAGATG